MANENEYHYNPAYLHEQALANAVKKLYMLGSRPRKVNHGSDIGEGVGSMFAAGVDQQRRQKALIAENEAKRKAQEKLDKEQFDEDVLEIRGWSPRSEEKADKYLVSEGESLPMPYEDASITAKEAQERIKANDIASETRFGGRYTPQGLKMIDINSQKNADDLIRARSMIRMGIGGSQRGAGGY